MFSALEHRQLLVGFDKCHVSVEATPNDARQPEVLESRTYIFFEGRMSGWLTTRMGRPTTTTTPPFC